MDQNDLIECGGFYFIYNFDSGNLGHVERVPTELIAPSAVNPKTNQSETPDYEFNLWTRPDCAGTKFENGNRTWFYFGIQANVPNTLVRLNLINLNKQNKMYAQGMAPVTRTLPGKPQWERIRDRPVHNMDDNTFTLSFKYRTSDNTKATTFFAFTYPFSFAELQIALNSIDMKMLPLPPPQSPDDIYYCRECVIYSLEGRRVDLLTISSHHGIRAEREERLKNLFPEKQDRPFKFLNKKVIFISARVHPGETPSSFVFNGFLNLLLNRHDPIAIQLRKLYVFKMIPFLNPDGVARGHYRTDTRGVNLNRVYLNPSLILHPTVYASRALIRFYHFGCEKTDNVEECNSFTSRSLHNISESAETTPSIQARSSTAKARMVNKSSTTLKRASTESKRDSFKGAGAGLSGEASKLAVQVYDMSIREMPSQTSSSSITRLSGSNLPAPASSSLLNEQALRSCLGSNVHLSTSEELKFQGHNPLQPLRQTLKTSISLLMDSNSPNNDSNLTEDRLGNVKMGWCRECRASISKLENTMPGLANLVPGYASREVPADVTFNSIEEYREHQKKQLEEQAEWFKEFEKMTQEPREEGAVYFCTNCFKRYILSEDNEEILCDTVSVTSVAVPAGDNESVRGEPASNKPAASTGDTLQSSPPAKAVAKVAKAAKPAPKKKAPTAAGAGAGAGAANAVTPGPPPAPASLREPDSGLFMYLDLHGHASKKGIFMYGNHFEDVDSCVECMLLPRIMSLNNLHFHFSSCNFTERNMYLKDRRDGMSREGSGRVAMYKTTGLVRCYTLECNYNTGRLVNVLPPTVRDSPTLGHPGHPDTKANPVPPKYTPHIFEEVKSRSPIRVRPWYNQSLDIFEDIDPFQVGRSLGASILDLTGQHPNSRLPGSEHRNLSCLREWLRAHTRTSHPQLNAPRLRQKTSSQGRLPLYPRPKGKATDERKENVFREGERRGGGAGGGAAAAGGAAPALAAALGSTPAAVPAAPLAPRAPVDVVNLNVRIPRHGHLHPPAAASSSRPRFMQDDTKGKTVGVKRRTAMSIRKPSSTKTALARSRRSADDSATGGAGAGVPPGRVGRAPSVPKLAKRSFERGLRAPAPAPRCRAMASSSSEELLVPSAKWEDVGTLGGTALSADGGAARRRAFPPPAHAHLKKIRLKAGL